MRIRRLLEFRIECLILYSSDMIRKENIVFGDKIGEGCFGCVFKGRMWCQNVAIKTIRSNFHSVAHAALSDHSSTSADYVFRTAIGPDCVDFSLQTTG